MDHLCGKLWLPLPVGVLAPKLNSDILTYKIQHVLFCKLYSINITFHRKCGKSFMSDKEELHVLHNNTFWIVLYKNFNKIIIFIKHDS